MGEFMKMTWMFFWRIGVLNIMFGKMGFFTVLLVSLVIAGVIRFGAKKSIEKFPIFRLLTGKQVIIDLRKRKGTYSGGQRGTGSTSLNPFQNLPRIQSASSSGLMTGYEPKYLDNVPVPHKSRFLRMRGVPGSGLDAAINKMGENNVRSGQLGETNFAKALSITDFNLTKKATKVSDSLLGNVDSFWSVAMPSEHSATTPDSKFNTDIDCILVAGNNIILVDTKFYKSGDVTYNSYGNSVYCIDNKTGSLIGSPYKMSKNMEMALDRFKKHFPTMRVTAEVVLIPTNSGSPMINNVVWPGNIKAINVMSALSNASELGKKGNGNQRVLSSIAMLVKN